MKTTIYNLNGRVCYGLPLQSDRGPNQIRPGYTRVLIPYTEGEMLRAKNYKRAHVQVVRHSKLKVVKENLLATLSR